MSMAETGRRLSPDRHVRYLATKCMGRVPVIKDTLEAVSGDPPLLAARGRQFDEVLNQLSYYLVAHDGVRNPELYPNVAALREQVGGVWLSEKGIGTLSEGYQRARRSNDEEIRTFQIAENTFKEVAGLITNGDWNYVNGIEDPGVRISALLIEGWGLFLERVTEIEGIRPIFVRAFEEVLGSDYPKSDLWKDVCPWVLEERDSFSPEFVSAVSRAEGQIE